MSQQQEKQVKVGDLVRISQTIEEYRLVMGKKVGAVIEVIIKPSEGTDLLKIYWSGNDFEYLYTDEVELVSEGR